MHSFAAELGYPLLPWVLEVHVIVVHVASFVLGQNTMMRGRGVTVTTPQYNTCCSKKNSKTYQSAEVQNYVQV